MIVNSISIYYIRNEKLCHLFLLTLMLFYVNLMLPFRTKRIEFPSTYYEYLI